MIQEGRITINGRIAEMGDFIDKDVDRIRYDGDLLDPNKSYNIKTEVKGWRAEKREKKEFKLNEAKKNPKSKLLRNGRKQSSVKKSKLDMTKQKRKRTFI